MINDGPEPTSSRWPSQRRTLESCAQDESTFFCSEITRSRGPGSVGNPISHGGGISETQALQAQLRPAFRDVQHHAGNDLIDQVRFMADQGFTAMEDNDMWKREPATQEAIAAELDRLGMTMGVFVAYADFKNPTFISGRTRTGKCPGENTRLGRGREAGQCQVGDRGARDLRSGTGMGLPDGQHHRPAQSLLRNLRTGRAGHGPGVPESLEEPPGPFSDQDPPGLPDLPGGQQSLLQDPRRPLPSADHRGEPDPEHGYGLGRDRVFPGRRQPGSQGTHHRRDQLPNIFRHIHDKGYTGIIGMEHGKSQKGIEGEKALLAAYRACDSF